MKTIVKIWEDHQNGDIYTIERDRTSLYYYSLKEVEEALYVGLDSTNDKIEVIEPASFRNYPKLVQIVNKVNEKIEEKSKLLKEKNEKQI